MKLLPWIVAVAGTGFAGYILFTRSDMEYATGPGDADDAARKAFGWGTKQRAPIGFAATLRHAIKAFGLSPAR